MLVIGYENADDLLDVLTRRRELYLKVVGGVC